MTVEVGGPAATNVDTIEGIQDGIVPAFIFVVVGSYLILLLTFGSVFLPLKAIFVTLLSITASLGALVLVFQDGRLENLLGFTATGEIISVTPILMFCIMFGLSMDYEALMLTRIQEEYQRTGNNTASVAFGLEKTAKVITGAAAIMIVAFGAFMLAGISIIMSFGFALSIAVLIDATIVRALLVPATMRLMGDWNWWAPRPVRSLVDRLGLAHTEPASVGVGCWGLVARLRLSWSRKGRSCAPSVAHSIVIAPRSDTLASVDERERIDNGSTRKNTTFDCNAGVFARSGASFRSR